MGEVQEFARDSLRETGWNRISGLQCSGNWEHEVFVGRFQRMNPSLRSAAGAARVVALRFIRNAGSERTAGDA